MADLQKFIILSPEQLQRLQGRDHALTSQSDADRQRALHKVSKDIARIGPTQAYAHYRAAQQRHLHHAAQERATPLVMTMSTPAPVPAPPPSPTSSIDWTQVKKEEKEEEKREREEEKGNKKEEKKATAGGAKASRSKKKGKPVKSKIPVAKGPTFKVKKATQIPQLSPRLTRAATRKNKTQTGAGGPAPVLLPWLTYRGIR